MVLPVNGVGSGRRGGSAEGSDRGGRAGEDEGRERPFLPRRERFGRGATGGDGSGGIWTGGRRSLGGAPFRDLRSAPGRGSPDGGGREQFLREEAEEQHVHRLSLHHHRPALASFRYEPQVVEDRQGGMVL